MTTPALPQSTRFFQPEISKCYWLPSVADKTAPTRAEMQAGTDLSGEIADVEGFATTSEDIETPDMGSRFTSRIPGRISAEDSNITFYGSPDGQDVRTVLSRNMNGFVMWCDGGDEPGYPADVYPVRVSSEPKQRSVSDEAFRIQLMFSVTSEPAENVTIPA